MNTFTKKPLEKEAAQTIKDIKRVLRIHEEMCEHRGYFLDVYEIDTLCRLLNDQNDLYDHYQIIIETLDKMVHYYDNLELKILSLDVSNEKKKLREWYLSLPPEFPGQRL